MERVYCLHRARRVHSDRLNNARFPAASVPNYVRGRLSAGVQLPMVEVVVLAATPAAGAQKKQEQGKPSHAAVTEEERVKVLEHVVKGLNDELVTELMEGITPTKGGAADDDDEEDEDEDFYDGDY